LISLAAAALLLVAGAVVVVGMATPVSVEVGPPPGIQTVAAGPPGPAEEAAPRRSFPAPEAEVLAAVARKPLRQPLFDQSQPVAPTQTTTPQPTYTLRVRLIGLAHEPGHSVAMLRKSDGTIELAAEGHQFNDAGSQLTVAAIEPEQVIIDSPGGRHTLQLPLNPEGVR
jgi:hypothetical protein